MNLQNELKTWLLLKNLVRTVSVLEKGLAEQNRLLKRIADRIAPEMEQEPVEQTTRSVDYSTDDFQVRVLNYMDDVMRKVGRMPTEDEIVEYLEENRAGRH